MECTSPLQNCRGIIKVDLIYVETIAHLQAENTYLLTLDGDIDFKAESVTLLVDRMRKNKKVGAACGRIHPIGTGTCDVTSLSLMSLGQVNVK